MTARTEPYLLVEWAVVGPEAGPYEAPEQVENRLTGLCPERAAEVGGFLRLPITTSPVVAYDPVTRTAVTSSGSRYTLVGGPAAGYAKWCKARGLDPMVLFTGR